MDGRKLNPLKKKEAQHQRPGSLSDSGFITQTQRPGQSVCFHTSTSAGGVFLIITCASSDDTLNCLACTGRLNGGVAALHPAVKQEEQPDPSNDSARGPLPASGVSEKQAST